MAGCVASLDAAHRLMLIEAMAETMIRHTEELTTLDQAIGDGDHGLNMRRGFEAVQADARRLSQLPLPEALKAIGTTLVMTVGGAAGPLYGTFFLALAKSIGPQGKDFAATFASAVDAVHARGKSQPGQKTLLDVLAPVGAAIAANGPGLLHRLPLIAETAAVGTIPMLAIRGRASFLGERSIGHMDPGARSTALLIAAACRALEG